MSSCSTPATIIVKKGYVDSVIISSLEQENGNQSLNFGKVCYINFCFKLC